MCRYAMASPVSGVGCVVVADRHFAVHGALLYAESNASIGVRASEFISLVLQVCSDTEGGAFALAPLRGLQIYGLIGDIHVEGHGCIRSAAQAPAAADDQAISSGIVTNGGTAGVLLALTAKRDGVSFPC